MEGYAKLPFFHIYAAAAKSAKKNKNKIDFIFIFLELKKIYTAFAEFSPHFFRKNGKNNFLGRFSQFFVIFLCDLFIASI